MGQTKAKKASKTWEAVYLKMPLDAYAALKKLEKQTGKNRTRIIVDYVTEQRQFSPELEEFIDDEMERRGLSSRRATVEKLISEAIQVLKQHQTAKGPSAT